MITITHLFLNFKLSSLNYNYDLERITLATIYIIILSISFYYINWKFPPNILEFAWKKYRTAMVTSIKTLDFKMVKIIIFSMTSKIYGHIMINKFKLLI